jgi:ADP-ribosylglycohydrolase
MSEERTYDRILGALYGVAMGDAFGMPCEMWSRRRIRDTYGYIDKLYPGNPENEISAGLREGEVTDDTVFTLIISRMLIEHSGGIDPQTFVDKIRQWAHDDEKSKNVLGPSTKRAILEIENGRPIEYAGRMGESNGASMRILPVGVISDYRDLPSLVENVREICLPTHNTSKAIGGACAVAAAVSYAIRCGESLETMVDIAFDVCGPSVAKRIRYAVEIAKAAETDEDFMQSVYDMVGTGLPTVQTVPAALAIAVYAKGDPNRCVRLAVNTGGDTDTIGAISCGIAGAYSGIDRFDRSVLDKVIAVNELDMESIAGKLLELYY